MAAFRMDFGGIAAKTWGEGSVVRGRMDSSGAIH